MDRYLLFSLASILVEANWYVYLGKNAAHCCLPVHKFGSGHSVNIDYNSLFKHENP